MTRGTVPTGLANTKSLEITNAEDLEQGEHLANTVGNGDPWATLDKMWHHTEHCLWVNDSVGKESSVQETGVLPWVEKISWRRKWQLQYFARRISWTEEPGRLPSMGSQRVGHDCAANFYFHRTFKMLIIYDPRIPLLYMCTRKQVKKILSAAQCNGNYSKQPKCLAILLRKYIRKRHKSEK